jgi:hypothetical protein
MRAHFLWQIAFAYHFSGRHQVSMFSSNKPSCCSVNLRRLYLNELILIASFNKPPVPAKVWEIGQAF